MQQAGDASLGGNRRGGEDHEGGTCGGCGSPCRRMVQAIREWTSGALGDGGAHSGQPHERQTGESWSALTRLLEEARKVMGGELLASHSHEVSCPARFEREPRRPGPVTGRRSWRPQGRPTTCSSRVVDTSVSSPSKTPRTSRRGASLEEAPRERLKSLKGPHGRTDAAPCSVSRVEPQEGNGRGDAVRLSARGILRRV
jgi:hypothetical protein